MKNKLYILFEEIFAVTFVALAVFLALELLAKGLISNYFDLNLLLVLNIASGLISLFHRKGDNVV